MTSLKEKERRKEQQDRFQAILSALLKDEDNKYCVDCDAKGPRWASWNLGIFLCIRCAGIHRNLGVHISKVKSVNLDTWTPEQVAMMQEIGNSRARAAYEANLPDGYRRPQTDSALEAFIRSKYEHKKYMAREWVPPQPKVPKEWLEEKTDRRKMKPKSGSAVQLTSIPKPSQPATEVSKPQPQKIEVARPEPVASSANDLLGLDLGNPQPQTQQQPPVAASGSSGGNDLLELFGGPQPAAAQPPPVAQQQPPQQQTQDSSLMNGSTTEANLFGEDPNVANGEKKASTKDSIMALFGGATSQPQMYGVPGGMYLPQGQQMYPGMMGQQQQQGMMGQQPQQGMMGQQPQQGMMGQQPQGMMGQPQQGMMGQQPQGMMGQPQQGMMGQQQQGMMGSNSTNMMGSQGMMGPAQGMMGAQPQGMVGQMPGMMGQQTQGMMGNPAMNGTQAGMYPSQGQGQMMGANTGVYTPQQMQQLQYQQMQQQMSSLKLGGNQMNAMPQQMPPTAGGWGAPATGQTLSTNLWQ